jgi:hypothetical protein
MQGSTPGWRTCKALIFSPVVFPGQALPKFRYYSTVPVRVMGKDHCYHMALLTLTVMISKELFPQQREGTTSNPCLPDSVLCGPCRRRCGRLGFSAFCVPLARAPDCGRKKPPRIERMERTGLARVIMTISICLTPRGQLLITPAADSVKQRGSSYLVVLLTVAVMVTEYSI